MKRALTIGISFLISLSIHAQNEITAFTATGSGIATSTVSDYHSLGINAANLGWNKSEKRFTVGLLEVGASLFSDALEKKELKQAFLRFDDTQMTPAEKNEAARNFTNSNLAFNMSVNWIGFSFQDEKLGGIAFSVRERIGWNSFFNETVAGIMFEGLNAAYFDSVAYPGTDSAMGISTNPQYLSKLTNNSRLSGNWYREYTLGYGRKLLGGENFSLYVGGAIKYLSGYGILDVMSENGELTMYSALSPAFDINYSAPTPSQITKEGLVSVGSGFGFDLGGSIILWDKLHVSAALNDIGAITWNGNLYQAEDTMIMEIESSGFASYNIFKEAETILADSGLFNWEGLEKKTIALPTNFRIGASYHIEEKLELGIDFFIPANEKPGNYDKAIISAGAKVKILPWLFISAGAVSGGNYENINVPLGAQVRFSFWEAGIASRDALTFFTRNNPTLSFTGGFMRFRF